MGMIDQLCIPVEPEEFVEADLREGDTKNEVQHVGGNHGDHVQFELETFHVPLTELLLILHQQSLLQVTCKHTNMIVTGSCV